MVIQSLSLFSKFRFELFYLLPRDGISFKSRWQYGHCLIIPIHMQNYLLLSLGLLVRELWIPIYVVVWSEYLYTYITLYLYWLVLGKMNKISILVLFTNLLQEYKNSFGKVYKSLSKDKNPKILYNVTNLITFTLSWFPSFKC